MYDRDHPIVDHPVQFRVVDDVDGAVPLVLPDDASLNAQGVDLIEGGHAVLITIDGTTIIRRDA
jgi:hypothetical protein